MAFRCHLSMDLLCQEVRDACRGSSESLDAPRSLCSECLEGRRRCSDAQVPSFSVVREMKEKERERRALLSCVLTDLFFSKFGCLNMMCLWNEGVPSFLLCHLVL